MEKTKNHFAAEFFSGNRQKLREACSDAKLIILTANGRLQKNADESFPFRQDSSFWYFTGLDVPDAILVIDVPGKREFVILPHRDTHRDQWETNLNLQEMSTTSGIHEMHDSRTGTHELKALLAQSTSIHTLLPPSSRFYNFYGIHANPTRLRLLRRLKRMKPGLRIESIRDQVKNLRIIKQPIEIQAITSAIKITEAAMTDVHRALPDLSYEYEVRAVLHAGFEKRGAGAGFDTIVAAGSSASLIHYEQKSKRLNDDEMLLIDAGAAAGYYPADITRMFAPKVVMTKRQKQVFDAVKRVQDYARTTMKPGVVHREYELEMHRYMGEELIRLGLISKPTKNNIHKYFPHATSHHLGLDVHDIANYDEKFQPDMVLTIEPGVYIPEEGIGVRIEDDVIVTNDGFRVLSDGLPKLLV